MPPSTTPQHPNFAVNSAQNALVEGLQPALRSTLSSLNINLDYELARYRYAKRGEAPIGVPPTQFRSRRKPSLDLINVPQSSPAARTGAMPPPPPPNPRLQQIESPPGMTESTSEVAALRSAIVPQSTTAQAGYMAASEAPSQDFGFSEVAPTRASRRRANKWLTPLGLGALLLLLVSSAGLGFLLVNPTAASNLFQQTPLARFFPSEETEEDVTAAGEVLEEEIAGAALAEPPLTPLSPDLSQREFSDLELNNLSNLPSSSASLLEENALQNLPAGQSEGLGGERASVASRESIGTPQRVNQIPTTTTPAPQPAAPVYQAPAPTSAEQATQPAPPVESRAQPAPPAVSAAPSTSDTTSQSPQSAYYVVTDYTGDPSLDDARTVIQDAYVRNFDMGARIQLGAFSSQEGATELTETLRDQGIEAEIYEP